jgi:hypothetical protein
MAQPVRLPRRAAAGLSPVRSCSPRVAVVVGSFGRGDQSRRGVRCWATGQGGGGKAGHRVVGSNVWSGGSSESSGWR